MFWFQFCAGSIWGKKDENEIIKVLINSSLAYEGIVYFNFNVYHVIYFHRIMAVFCAFYSSNVFKLP